MINNFARASAKRNYLQRTRSRIVATDDIQRAIRYETYDDAIEETDLKNSPAASRNHRCESLIIFFYRPFLREWY
jgi:hypothetical protein